MEVRCISDMINSMNMGEFIQWFEDNQYKYSLVPKGSITELQEELTQTIEYIENYGVDWDEIKGEVDE